MTDHVSSKYFKQEEAKETLCGMYEDGDKLVTRVHTYKTLAVYSGKWKGGMRHSLGTMRWADSAQYIGEWSFNQAQGQGKFIHTDGDVYEGQWYNNKANGKGVYTNVKGARYEGDWKDDQ